MSRLLAPGAKLNPPNTLRAALAGFKLRLQNVHSLLGDQGRFGRVQSWASKRTPEGNGYKGNPQGPFGHAGGTTPGAIYERAFLCVEIKQMGCNWFSQS